MSSTYLQIKSIIIFIIYMLYKEITHELLDYLYQDNILLFEQYMTFDYRRYVFNNNMYRLINFDNIDIHQNELYNYIVPKPYKYIISIINYHHIYLVHLLFHYIHSDDMQIYMCFNRIYIINHMYIESIDKYNNNVIYLTKGLFLYIMKNIAQYDYTFYRKLIYSDDFPIICYIYSKTKHIAFENNIKEFENILCELIEDNVSDDPYRIDYILKNIHCFINISPSNKIHFVNKLASHINESCICHYTGVDIYAKEYKYYFGTVLLRHGANYCLKCHQPISTYNLFL